MNICVLPQEVKEKECIVVLSVDELISLVWNQQYGSSYTDSNNSLCKQCQKWKSSLCTNSLTIIVCGLEEYFRLEVFTVKYH